MSDFIEIKKRILEQDKVEDLLEDLGCEHVRDVGERVEAQLPESFNNTNRRAVQVYKNEYLPSYVRNRGINTDIFGLIAYILYGSSTDDEVKDNLFQIKVYICNLFKWNTLLERRDDFEDEPIDRLGFLRPIQKDRKKRKRKQLKLEKENRVLSRDNLNRYIKCPHMHFYKDGIKYDTQCEYEIMFDQESERVVFPIYNKHGDLISVKGRYAGKDSRILESTKYLYLFNFDKSIELFNYHKAIEHIRKQKEVIVFESEKSCMLAWQYGFKNTVAICGSGLSPVQVYSLMRMEVNIIFALDKGIGSTQEENKMSDKDYIKHQARHLKTRLCFYIDTDNNDILNIGDAPIDKGEQVWIKLYKEYVKTLKLL